MSAGGCLLWLGIEDGEILCEGGLYDGKGV